MDIRMIMQGIANMQDDVINHNLGLPQQEQDQNNRDFSKFLDKILEITSLLTIEKEVGELLRKRKALKEKLK